MHEGVTVDDHGFGLVTVNVATPCSQLTHDGLCGLYDTPDRPDVCGLWPQSPLDLLQTPYCGYQFRKVT